MDIDDTTKVKEVIMKDIKTGKTWNLGEYVGKDQHYMKFDFKKYHIQLRLDWKDWKKRGKKGEPTLDVDIWPIGKVNSKNKLKGPWHHIPRIDSVYKLVFNDLELILQPKRTVGKTITADIVVNDVLSIKKNDEEVFNNYS